MSLRVFPEERISAAGVPQAGAKHPVISAAGVPQAGAMQAALQKFAAAFGICMNRFCVAARGRIRANGVTVVVSCILDIISDRKDDRFGAGEAAGIIRTAVSVRGLWQSQQRSRRSCRSYPDGRCCRTDGLPASTSDLMRAGLNLPNFAEECKHLEEPAVRTCTHCRFLFIIELSTGNGWSMSADTCIVPNENMFGSCVLYGNTGTMEIRRKRFDDG